MLIDIFYNSNIFKIREFKFWVRKLYVFQINRAILQDFKENSSPSFTIYMLCFRTNQIPYKPEDLPASLFKYLKQAHECVNPNCEGVYFDHRLDFVALTFH